MKELTLIEKNELNIGDTINFKDKPYYIVNNHHGEYDNHQDKLTLIDLYKKYPEGAILKIIGIDIVSRRNIINTDREVYLAEICQKETSRIKKIIAKINKIIKNEVLQYYAWLIIYICCLLWLIHIAIITI